MKAVIIGGGSFGTAVGTAIAGSGVDVTLYVRTNAQASSINLDRRNLKYLPDFRLPRNLRGSSDMDCIADADVIFLAVPSHSIEKTCQTIRSKINPGACVVNLAKGLHEQYVTMNKAISIQLPGIAVGSLKGPTFARPLLHGAPSGMTLAVDQPQHIEHIQSLFRGCRVQIEAWESVDDVEFVSALKNVFAIAMGICDAIEDNGNTRFLVMQKIIKEARSLVKLLGYGEGVLFTYAGLGDLLMTSLSDISRNRTLGLLMGRGFELAINENGPVLEGKRSTRLLYERITDIDAYQIISGLYRLFERSLLPHDFFDLVTSNHGPMKITSTIQSIRYADPVNGH